MELCEAHRQWAARPEDERYRTFGDLREAVHARRNRSRAFKGDLGALTLEAIGPDAISVGLGRAVANLAPTSWAFGQLAQRAGAPAGYLASLPAPLAVECLRTGLRVPNGERTGKLLVADSDNGPMLRAVTSEGYGRIWDSQVVDAVGALIERTGFRFFNPPAYNPKTGAIEPSGLYASDRDVFMFLVDGGSRLEAGPRAKLNRGFFAWNSETGARTFGLTTFFFNEVCGNHIVWGASGVREFKIRHTSGAPDRWLTEAMPELTRYVDARAGDDERVIRQAQRLMLPAPAERVEWFTDRAITRREAEAAVVTAEREEGQCASVWDAVQGLTAVARGYSHVDRRVDLERRAGKLLDIAL